MASDHPKLTSGGSVSNHFHGRAVDIATVDGRPVAPGNAAARELAVALSRLDPGIRPSEIGSPWALSGPAYFTDGGHQDHIHVGFDDPDRLGLEASRAGGRVRERPGRRAGHAGGARHPAEPCERRRQRRPGSR